MICSGIFDSNCIKYAHYLDTIMETNDFLFKDVVGKSKVPVCETCFTEVEEDVFDPKGHYLNTDDIPIVFDSGCTVAVNPHKADYVGKIKSVNKSITGLSSHFKVEGEGTVLRSFYDDYGVLQRVQIKVYYIPTSNVRLFSPQSYFRQVNGGSFMLNAKGMCSHLSQVKP